MNQRERFARITGLRPCDDDFDAGRERQSFYDDLSAMLMRLGHMPTRTVTEAVIDEERAAIWRRWAGKSESD